MFNKFKLTVEETYMINEIQLQIGKIQDQIILTFSSRNVNLNVSLQNG